MALNTSNLSPASVGSSSLPTVWNYKTTDNVTDLDVADYWGGSLAQMKAGDFVVAKCADGGALVCVTAIDQDAGTSTASIVGSGGNGGQVWVYGEMADVSAAGSVYVVAPVAGTITKFYTCLQGAITGANAAVKLQIAGVDVTNGSVTVAHSGSAAGDVDTATPTAANTVTAGAAIEVESDGASSTTAKLTFAILIQP